jgi:3,4-dihydroxy 2-butanone 4-phosphate synthase/GTP cyclohydrolase II
VFNEGYLETKRDRMGHVIDEIESDEEAAVAAERTAR